MKKEPRSKELQGLRGILKEVNNAMKKLVVNQRRKQMGKSLTKGVCPGGVRNNHKHGG